MQLIGSKLVTKLREHGHDAVAASPNSGVNTITGEGLAEALRGASPRARVGRLWRRISDYRAADPGEGGQHMYLAAGPTDDLPGAQPMHYQRVCDQ